MVRRHAADIIERIARIVTTRGGRVTPVEAVGFGRALVDLVDQIERAARILTQLVELVNPQAPPVSYHLSPRELEILSYLAEARTNAEIAKQCRVSKNTLKYHLKNLFRKLGVRDRGQAIMIARAISRRLGVTRGRP